MKAIAHIRCAVGLIALAIVLAPGVLGANKKSRDFNAPLDLVWTAAVDVASEAFLTDRISKEEGRFRFRAGPLRGYRFEVLIVDAGAGKTRVVVELRTNHYAVEKDAWRNGDRYLTLVAQRVQRGGRK